MSEKFYMQDIINSLAERQGLNKREAEIFVKTMFDLIEEALDKDKVVKIKGLGTFKLTEVDSRESVDINTGKRFQIAGHTKISFIPDGSVRDLINKPFSHFETVILNENTVFGDNTIVEETEIPNISEKDNEQIEENVEEESEVEESELNAEKEIIIIGKDQYIEEVENNTITSDVDDTVDTTPTPLIVFEDLNEETSDDNADNQLPDNDISQDENLIIENDTIIFSAADHATIELVNEESVNPISSAESVKSTDIGDDLSIQPGTITTEKKTILPKNVEVEKTEDPVSLAEARLKEDQKLKEIIQAEYKDKKKLQQNNYISYIVIIIITIIMVLTILFFIYKPSFIRDLFLREKPTSELLQPNIENNPSQKELDKGEKNKLLITPDSLNISENLRSDTLSAVGSLLSAENNTNEIEEQQRLGAIKENKQKHVPEENDEEIKRQAELVMADTTKTIVSGLRQGYDDVRTDSTSYIIVGTMAIHRIAGGETLTRISNLYYGTKDLWPYLIRHNRNIIPSPDHVAVGQIIKIPALRDRN